MPISAATSSTLLVVVLFAGVGFSTARAADPPSQEDEPRAPVPTVEVSGSRSSGERQAETTTRIIVGQDEILRHGDHSLADVLKRLPGVTVGGPGDLRMRGLGAGYTQVLVNGETVAPGFAVDSIPPELIERIEIMRSASAEFSTQAIAGTINIILRKSARQADRQIKLGMGRNQERWSPSGTLQWSDRDGALSYSVAGSVSRLGNHTEPVVEEVTRNEAGEPVSVRRFEDETSGRLLLFNVVPRLNWTFESGDTLTLQSFLEYGRVPNAATERETTLLGSSTDYPINSWTSQGTAPSIRGTLTWEHRLREHDKLIVNVGEEYLKRETDYSFYGYDAGNDPRLDRNVVSNARDLSYKASGKYLTRVGESGNLALGWDGAYTERSEQRIQTDTRPFDPQTSVLNESYDANVKRLALFAQSERELTPRLQLYTGVRWEGLDTVVGGRTLDSVRNRSKVWSPILQGVWKLPNSERDQLRLGVSRTYKPPRTRDLVPRRYTTNNNNSPTTPDTQGNPRLRPELAWGLDLAYESYFGANGILSISVFARQIDDVTVVQLFEQDDIWVSAPSNGGKADVRGIEAEAKFPLRSLLESMPNVDIRANFARNWSTLDSVPGPYNRLSEQKPISANFGFDYAASDAVTFGLNYNLQGGGPVRLTSTLGSYTEANETIDVFGLWKMDAQTQVRLSLTNVLNRDGQADRFFEDADESVVRRATTPTTTGIRFMLERKF